MSCDKAILAALEPLEGLRTAPGPVELLREAVPPFVFFLQVYEEETDTLEGGAGLFTSEYEIHLVTALYAQLQELAPRVRLALRGLAGQTVAGTLVQRVTVEQASPDLREREVGYYRRVYRARFNYQEEDES